MGRPKKIKEVVVEKEKNPMFKYKLKAGFGAHNLRGKKYVAGDIVEVIDPDVLGNAIDKFELINKDDVSDLITEAKEPKAKLIRLHKGGGRYQVLNPETREPVNDNWLTKDEAMHMTGEIE